ncbi:M61 family metallopeptidase [Alteromonas flava]|uniref:M61 family metallopeptidase n=1 Tax=Alteromonas flava TaxID=2048003 RepID=UPI0013DD4051|nr:PDZ domain-containing protein [Alteromonas flava]
MSDIAPIVYQLNPESKSQHLFAVRVAIPEQQQPTLTLSMPAWIPGSYMIRDFSKNIGEFSARDEHGRSLEWHKTDKQTWRIGTQGKACVVTYKVYAFDLSVRSAYLNDEYGFINGTSAFMAVHGAEATPCLIHLELDPDRFVEWKIVTGMPCEQADKLGIGIYSARNYQQLIDYPILFGKFIQSTFRVDELEAVLVFTGDLPLDLVRMSNDLTPILRQHMQMFADTPPIEKYWFITLLTEQGFGGLEHTNSTVLMFPRWDLPLAREDQTTDAKSESYRDFLALCSHEFLHTWHVKRTKPAIFSTYHLDKESYTNQLWIYEGFTSFYDDLALARAKAITPEQYLSMVAKNITRLLRNPGRLKQSAAESSYDAWTRFYQQDANSINHIVSYYTKGGLIALCLDIYLRRQSQGKYSLDDVMRHLWQSFGKKSIGTPDNVIHKIVESLLGSAPDKLLHEWVYQAGELPLAESLAEIGATLHLSHAQDFDDLGGKAPSAGMQNGLGITVKPAETGLIVQQVREGSNACRAGLQVGDRLLACNQWVVNKINLTRLLKHANECIELTLIRDGRLLSVDCQLEAATPDTAHIELTDRTRFAEWLGITE